MKTDCRHSKNSGLGNAEMLRAYACVELGGRREEKNETNQHKYVVFFFIFMFGFDINILAARQGANITIK